MQDLEKVTVRLNRGDKNKIETFFPEVGYNRIVRALVSDFIKKVEEKAQRTIGKIATPEIDISSLTPDKQEEPLDA